jgi:hypothetical protein
VADEIKHPQHYNEHPSGVECIAIIQHFGFNVGAAIKHLWRAGTKENVSYKTDLEKAAQYIAFELARAAEFDLED